MKVEEILTILKGVTEETKERYKIYLKGIFGSFVRGEEHSGSDVDVLVEFENDADLIDLGVATFGRRPK
ncbi:MAG: nucleotidyltransferase domain-containing protein [bacterium]|nr:nucleotidyltransferase domain-containing protein [bacterium]